MRNVFWFSVHVAQSSRCVRERERESDRERERERGREGGGEIERGGDQRRSSIRAHVIRGWRGDVGMLRAAASADLTELQVLPL